MSAIPNSIVNYQSAADRTVAGHGALGSASISCWGLSLVHIGVCVAGLAHYARGFEGLLWIAAALMGSWIFGGAGACLGLCGVRAVGGRHRFAVTGLILNLVTVLSSVVVILANVRFR
jgi:hypothetical protein